MEVKKPKNDYVICVGDVFSVRGRIGKGTNDYGREPITISFPKVISDDAMKMLTTFAAWLFEEDEK